MLCPIPSNIVFQRSDDPLPSLLRRYPQFDPAEAANIRDRLVESIERRYPAGSVRNFGALLNYSLARELRKQSLYHQQYTCDVAYSDALYAHRPDPRALGFVDDLVNRDALHRLERQLPPDLVAVHRAVLNGSSFCRMARELKMTAAALRERYYRALDQAVNSLRAELGLAPLEEPVRFVYSGCPRQVGS